MITNVLPLFHILRVHYEWEMDCLILQGRVSTLFRWGGHIFSRVFVSFLPAYISAKIMKIECVFPELWSQMYCHVYFRDTVYKVSWKSVQLFWKNMGSKFVHSHYFGLVLQQPVLSHNLWLLFTTDVACFKIRMSNISGLTFRRLCLLATLYLQIDQSLITNVFHV